jgi:hypothetical protein
MQAPFPTSCLILSSSSSFGVGDQIVESSLCPQATTPTSAVLFSLRGKNRCLPTLDYEKSRPSPRYSNLMRALELLKPALVYESLKRTARFRTSYN